MVFTKKTVYKNLKMNPFNLINVFVLLDSFVLSIILLTIILSILISVAYFTLMERKVLAAMQRRRGPNVVGVYGVLQPLADGLKLMGKEGIIPTLANVWVYLAAPGIAVVMSFCGWIALPMTNINVINMNNDLDILIFFCLTSLGSYGVVLAGWGSFSRYAVMGGLRAIAQLISYEVIFLLSILPPAMIVGTFNFNAFATVQSESCWNIFPCLPSALIFFILMLAETNRTPFDLPEAEAELVSGFNVEYSSILFAMFTLAEYNSMLMMSALYTILFLGGWSAGVFVFIIKTLCIAFLIINVRAALPRYRYDQLMYLCWYILLPLCLSLVIFTAGMCVELGIYGLNPTELALEVQKKNDVYFDMYFSVELKSKTE